MIKNTIYEIELLDILPSSIKYDPDIIAASKAIDTGFFLLVNELQQLVILSRIEFQNSNVLDHIAYFFHVDFYDVSFDVETKRKIILESVYLHQIKGTPYAVEQVFKTVGINGKVSEWFEYGGNPYFFRIELEKSLKSENEISTLVNMVNSMKNKRSRLENITLKRQLNSSLSFGGIISTRNKIQIGAASIQMPDIHQNKYYAGFISTRSITKIMEVQ